MTAQEILSDIRGISEKLDDIRNSITYFKTSVNCLVNDMEDNGDGDTRACEYAGEILNYLDTIQDSIGVKDTGIAGEIENIKAYYSDKALSQYF